MKSTFRNSMYLALVSAITALSMTACFGPGDGDDTASTEDSDEAELGVATEASTASAASISYWSGKVNAHLAPGSVWVKDNDCTSGATIAPLTYCQKFYPATISVTAVAVTTKPALLWNTSGCAQQYSGDGQQEWTCNQPSPRIAYWSGKVNAHRDSGGTWVKDNDCTSGATIAPLTYCRKFYPSTASVTSVAVSTKPALLWNTSGCAAQYSGDGQQEWTCNP